MVQPLWKTAWWFLEKVKIGLPNDPAVPLLSIYLKRLQGESRRGNCTPVFTAASLTIADRWKAPKCPPVDDGSAKHGPSLQWNAIHP